MRQALLIAIGLCVTAQAAWAQTANVQGLSVQYAVKFVCGTAVEGDDLRVVQGVYATAINVHNSAAQTEAVVYKVVTAPGIGGVSNVTGLFGALLGPDAALEIDCATIFEKLGTPRGGVVKGFVVIFSRALKIPGNPFLPGLRIPTGEGPLDITAVHTARPATSGVTTLSTLVPAPRAVPPFNVSVPVE